MTLKDSTERIRKQLEMLQKFTATPGAGVTRFPFTKEAREASEYIKTLMEDIGLEVRIDNTGSVIGRLNGEIEDTIMTGSHLDSVKNGGAYDGIAGVVASIEAMRHFKENNKKPYYSYEVIATNDEEGSRFKSGLFTGKVMSGLISVDDIKHFKDADGISVYEAMNDYGLKPNEIADHKRDDIKAFLEVHIEQGPILEKEEKDIGIVDVIVGIKRVIVTINGRPDHVGTTPMNMRKDAVDVATKVISKISDRARDHYPAVSTVGNIVIEPNIVNIIPSRVKYTVDFRSTSADVIRELYDGMIKDLEIYANEADMTHSVEETLWVDPVVLNDTIKGYIEESCKSRDFSNMHIISGAGHDAQVYGSRVPSAMIFVPSHNGRSHCPEEYTDEKTLAMASFTAFDTLKKIDEDKKF